MRISCFGVVALIWFAVLAASAPAQPIDRFALVERHSPRLSRIDPHAPLMLGNGDLGFTADITGLQTFPEQYSRLAPLLTMAQWAWHSFPNPHGYTEANGLVNVDVPGRGARPFAWMRSWDELQSRPALVWLRENPHRFSLGRIGLVFAHGTGQPAPFESLSETRQRLDVWSGALSSSFVYDGQRVLVETRVHPHRNMVMTAIRSPHVTSGRLGVAVQYPGVAASLNPDPSEFERDDLHATMAVQIRAGRWLLRRQLDETTYYSSITAPNAYIQRTGPHRFQVLARSGDRLVVMVSFERDARSDRSEIYEHARRAVSQHWRNYWMRGGVIDFSGSADPRAAELERRVVLSQYLAAVNGAGELPPQEEGLFSNSWNGKFHLEMHPWHAAHFAIWGRPQLLERSLAWYLQQLPRAQAEARVRGAEGAWWPKMVGPEGRNSPSTINPFIMWQQPHPIFMAELLYRARRDTATLARYSSLVEETARLLASWPRWDDEARRYVLGPPIIPAQESHHPLTTINPLFEIEYFRWGLQTAQKWRERRGLPREPEWDRVIAGLAPSPQRDGIYLPVENGADFWRSAMSARCARNATDAQCLNRDHPSFLMAYGFIGSDRIDAQVMRRTLRATEAYWDLRQTWGWDFPMVAMSAARLGEPESAIAWLFKDVRNNQWGSSGMTPRVHFNAHAEQLLADADAAGPDGPGYRRAAETYFPSNGALLLAVGMMAAGWDGSGGRAPGFPREGWNVRAEGLLPMP